MTAMQVDPLVDREVDPGPGPPRSTRGRRRPRRPAGSCPGARPSSPPVSTRRGPRDASVLAHPQPDRPVGEVDHVVGLDRGAAARPTRRDRVARPFAVASAVRVRFWPLRSCITPPSMSPEPDLRPGHVAQQPDLAAGALGVRRAMSTSCSCSSRVPWEKLSRRTSTPDRDQAVERSRDCGWPARAWRRSWCGACIERLLAGGPSDAVIEVEPAEELLRLAPAPGGTRSAMSPRPKRSSGQSDVITASMPASSRCWRHACAASTLSKSPTTSQSSKRGSSTCSSPWPGRAPRVAARARSQLIRSGRPRRNSSAYSPIIAAAPSGPGPSSPLRALLARPQTSSKNASVSQRGARHPDARGPVRAPGSTSRAASRRAPRASRRRAACARSPPISRAQLALEHLELLLLARVVVLRGLAGPRGSQIDSTSSSSPPVSAAVRRNASVWPVIGILAAPLPHSPCAHYAETSGQD